MSVFDSIPTTPVVLCAGEPLLDEAQLAAAAFLARYRGRTLESYRADLRQFFQWTAIVGLPPLQAKRRRATSRRRCHRPVRPKICGRDLCTPRLGAPISAEVVHRSTTTSRITGRSRCRSAGCSGRATVGSPGSTRRSGLAACWRSRAGVRLARR